MNSLIPEISLPKRTFTEWINIFSEIVKFRITFLVSLTTALGFILASDNVNYRLFFTSFGIFLLACSSSALNQYQERNLDKLMPRTQSRPIPAGKLSKNFVLNLSLLLLVTGTVMLFVFTNISTVFIGLATFVWYNFVYTILKRKSALAVIPGAVVGALPPLAGWASANGDLTDFRIYLIVLYFFIWQIPHFWLLLILYGKDYASAGFPVLNDLFSVKQLKYMTFLWISLTALLTSSIAFAGILHSVYSVTAVLLISVILFYGSVMFVKYDTKRKNVLNMFMVINIHTLLIIVFLSVDKILNY